MDSSTDQNQNYSQISSDESFSSRRSSTLSYEQPEHSNEQKTYVVDWDDVKRKLAVPISPDSSRQFDMLKSEIMDRQHSTARKNGTYQMNRDEILYRGLDLRSALLYDGEDTCSTSQFSREAP